MKTAPSVPSQVILPRIALCRTTRGDCIPRLSPEPAVVDQCLLTDSLRSQGDLVVVDFWEQDHGSLSGRGALIAYD